MAENKTKRVPMRKRKPIRLFPMMLLLTVFQLITFFQAGVQSLNPLEADFTVLAYMLAYIVIEWLYIYLTKRIVKRKNFEVEIIAFYLTGIGVAEIGAAVPDALLTQLAAVVLGLAVYTVLTWLVGDIDRAMKLRIPFAVLAIVVLAANIVLGEDINGARNWIIIGSVSVQPSEFVKIIFVFVGATTLEKLQTSKNLYMFIGFSVVCVGILFILKDLGTAVIFFLTFLLIAFMRSGDLRTIGLAVASAGLGGWLVLQFKPYAAKRFATYRHVWDEAFIDAGGYQQSRTLIGIASGGLFGLGLGKGSLEKVTFSSTDLVFGLVCEEMGLIIGVSIIACFILFAFFAVKNARTSRSAFYSIAATAAAGILLIQGCVNIFGVTDIIPLTGVTLPFISRGGSSVISCWGLLAFIKASDVRTYLSNYGEIKK